MSRHGDSAPPRRRRIEAAAKADFLAALRAGGAREDAAAATGFTLKGFYTARRRDPLFRLAWSWAMELSADGQRDARRAARAGGGGEVRIAPQGQRLLQRRRMRSVRFTEARQQIFLDFFAGTADAEASAEAAGVSYATVKAHRRKHPEFAAGWDAALTEAYVHLEAEAVRQRLALQRRLKDNIEPTGEMAQEFERVMKLLARWDRRGGRIGAREARPAPERRWTFEEAIAALDKRLRSLGIRRGLLPPPEDREEPS